MEKGKTYEAKIITLGDSQVGKTSLILRYLEDRFLTTYLSTIGFDLKHKIIKLDNGDKIKLIIHDTAGQERFKSLSRNYIKKANGILVVFDVTNKQSFLNIENWIKCAKEEITKKIPIFLVGNKSDLVDKREIQTEDGENMAEEFGVKFYETSCENGNNVEKCFTDLALEITRNLKEKENSSEAQNEKDKNLKISSKKGGKTKKCC
jgi:Ras-related protein Rab-8A